MSDGLFDDKQYATKLTQAEQFGAPPLSLLDAQQGYMRDRKQAWFADYPFLFGATGREEIVVDIWKSEERTDAFGVKLREMTAAPASIFDPALAEICYSWWTIPGSEIYDPFAGGPARGIVAAAMGRKYVGVDLRPEQVEANTAVAIDGASWICADSSTFWPAPCDFVFSCPPYGSLEVYSDDPADISTMSWEEFRIAYTASIIGAVDALRDNRFAAFVVGNYKEKSVLRDLVGMTVKAFTTAGAEYYCDVIYATPVGSAAIRAQTHFPKNRRPMPRHQYLLVFVKGDKKKAAAYVAAGATPAIYTAIEEEI